MSTGHMKASYLNKPLTVAEWDRTVMQWHDGKKPTEIDIRRIEATIKEGGFADREKIRSPGGTSVRKENIREIIRSLENGNDHLLQAPPATIQVNAVKALLQVSVRSKLDVLYEALGDPRPSYRMDGEP